MSTGSKDALARNSYSLGDLLSYEQLPQWRKDNPYILSNYRPISNSYWQCVRSLTYLHNQTGNIYSHLIVLILVSALVIYSLLFLSTHSTLMSSALPNDIMAFSTFLSGVIACMTFSATYHTFMSHSKAVALRGKQLDFAGITCLIWASMMPTLYYTFTCEVELMRQYMVLVCRALFNAHETAYNP